MSSTVYTNSTNIVCTNTVYIQIVHNSTNCWKAVQRTANHVGPKLNKRMFVSDKDCELEEMPTLRNMFSTVKIIKNTPPISTVTEGKNSN